MESTMKKYAQRIEKNEVNPHIIYDGMTDGLILDPKNEQVPLEILGFGIYQLKNEFIIRETFEKEIVIVPQHGECEIEVNGKRFSMARRGGPFAAGPGKTNASALYVPCNARIKFHGKGEIVFFEAPAFQEKSPYYVPPEDISVVSRGEWIWRRDVINLINPKFASSNLIVGETYNPPGFWSGTPIHRHDRDQRLEGESDHEEIYYHRFNWQKGEKDQFGPYGVQLLMDGEGLSKAFIIGDKSIFAIPGGCHPVVASPVSELLYLWGLAGKGGELAMKDIPEFAHIKRFEEIFKELEGTQPPKAISSKAFEGFSKTHGLTKDQKDLLLAMLREKGFIIN